MSLKKAVSLIRENNNFLISSHINPEADAIGSELGFLNLLRKLGKQGIIVNESNLPVECRELPGVKEIKQFPARKSPSAIFAVRPILSLAPRKSPSAIFAVRPILSLAPRKSPSAIFAVRPILSLAPR